MMMEDEGEERIRASYRGNYDRLTRVKKRYDPRQPLPYQPEHPTCSLMRAARQVFGRTADISVAATASRRSRWSRSDVGGGAAHRGVCLRPVLPTSALTRGANQAPDDGA